MSLAKAAKEAKEHFDGKIGKNRKFGNKSDVILEVRELGEVVVVAVLLGFGLAGWIPQPGERSLMAHVHSHSRSGPLATVGVAFAAVRASYGSRSRVLIPAVGRIVV